jgi:hypothetical protein
LEGQNRVYIDFNKLRQINLWEALC